ncbi:MAG TPA: hypothetical protein EYH31_05390 [Anaerolineae bacterium]|nr:hypothetical protein [Anaerolineae bacterium]
MDLKLFQNPPSQYRAAPFWSWNERLEDDELRRQIALMQEGGWGGFFMHARVGLETPYLSPEWFDRVRTSVDEAKQRGMLAWLYDEDKWPSGFAGGLSVASNRDYRMRTLICKPDNKPALVGERLRAFLARRVDGRLTDFRPIHGEEDLADVRWGDEWLVQFYPHTSPLGIEWFNDYTYLDMLNLEAVQAFIQSTYEPYTRAVGEEFGKTIPGIFTDEPCFIFQPDNVAGGPIHLPWTDGFPKYFVQQNGYDLLDHLPALVFDTSESPAIRYDYWRTITQRLVESWGKQLYDWCNAHNLALTGHYMAEDTLLDQIRWTGASMPHYEYMHIPGIDKLGRHIDEPITTKQVDSVACQLGRQRILCEAYGCAGQDLNFPQRKWIGDHLYVLGINLLNPHLSLYSMRGARKRDYPCNIFFQQPWWPENRLLDEYFARLSYALSQGQRVVEALVVHPIASAWTLYSPIAVHPVRELDRQLRTLNDDLLALHRDYHFGDEMLMEKYAAVESDGSGAVLRIGEMRYRVVIVPPGTTLARNTVDLLNRFTAAGGPVIAIEPTPTLVDGRPVDAVLPAATTVIPAGRERLRAALDQALPADVVIADAPEVLYQHRRVDDGDLFFLVNTSLEKEVVTRVRLPGQGRLERWDALSGRVEPLAGQMTDGSTELVLTFPPAGSHLLLMKSAEAEGAAPTAIEMPASIITRHRLDDEWQVERRDPNALTLDYCHYRLGEDDWSELVPVWKAHRAIRDEGGVGAPFALRFSFDMAETPPGPLMLVVETPERFRITVNGQAVQASGDYWRDISFRKVDITRVVQAGRNEIVLESEFGAGMELESVYLIGNFAVTAEYVGEAGRGHGQVFNYFRGPFILTIEPQTLTGDDLAGQGYPFFAGRILLRQTITPEDTEGRAFLEFHDPHAIVLNVRVNGHDADPLILPPYRVEVTDALRAGPNDVEIELVSSLRNLMGPHHQRGGDGDWVGPQHFENEAQWTDDYTLVPFGLGRVSLVRVA